MKNDLLIASEPMTASAHAESRLLIGGEMVATEERIDSIDPSTGAVWTTIPAATPGDVNAAVAAARAAFENSTWRRDHQNRGLALRRIAEVIRANADLLAEYESRDNGKALWATKFEVGNLPRYFDYFAGLADKVEGSWIPLENNLSATVRREPLGVIAAVTTWNSPLLLIGQKLAPALAAGNTVVIKPAENASASSLALLGLLADEDLLPAGVLNIVTGPASRSLVEHPGVDHITFTGGDATAERILAAAAKGVTSTAIEAGGKAAHIIFEDADLDKALISAVAGGFISSGQSCTAGTRVLVQASIWDEFVPRFVERAKRIKVGPSMDPTSNIGPLATGSHWTKVRDLVEAGVKEGAVRLLGATIAELPSDGYFYPVTVLSDVTTDMTVAQEEIFGPVVTLIKFKDEADAIQKANSTQYGLASGLWTRDGQKAERVAQALQAGMIWINCYRILHWAVPFGGHKRSGIGHENGITAVNEYTQTKSVMSASYSSQPDPFHLDN